MTIGVSVAGIVIAVATTATTIGMQEKAKGDAKKAAQIQKADAEHRAASEKNDAESEQMAAGISSMMATGSAAGGDPATQQYLEAAGYLPSSGGGSGGPGGSPGGQQGQPGQPADPSSPRQPSNPNQGPGGGPAGGIPS